MPIQRRPQVDRLILKYNGKPANFVFRTMEEIEGYQKSSSKATPPHRHNYYTIIWVKKGTGVHTIDFRMYDVKADTIYFLTPEQVHDLQLEKGAKGYVLLFTPDFTSDYGLSLQFIENTGFFFRCDDLAPFNIPEGLDSNNLEHLVHHVRDEFRSASPYYLDAIGSWLKLFLLECKGCLCTSSQFLNPEPALKQYLSNNSGISLKTIITYGIKLQTMPVNCISRQIILMRSCQLRPERQQKILFWTGSCWKQNAMRALRN